MNPTQKAEFRDRLLPQTVTLVERATGKEGDRHLIEALIDACTYLEDSSITDAPVVALERDVKTNTGTYHINIRRLNTSIPAGKFQVLITRELASGLIY